MLRPSSCILSPVEFAPLKRLGALLLIVLSACGKRGDPHPPLPVIPKATSDLVVAQRGGKVLLSWSYPSLTTAGKSLGAIRRIVIYRYVQDLPDTPPASAAVTPAEAAPTTLSKKTDKAKDGAAATTVPAGQTTETASAATPAGSTGTAATKAVPSGETKSTTSAKGTLSTDLKSAVAAATGPFAKVPPVGPAQFNREKKRLDSIEAAAMKAATSGSRLTFEDTPDIPLKGTKPVRVNYAVVTEAPAARGDLSNIAAIVPVDVPIAPGDLVATAKAEGVVLTWSAPQQTIGGGPKPFVVGYNVYRVAPGEEPGELDKPVNSSPIEKETYTDVPAYGSFHYYLTAIPVSLGVSVESDLSTAAPATFKDLVPPPVPAGLNALVEPHAVQLVWDAVEAADLAGYRVYRTEGSGIEKLIPVATISLTKDPITVTTFRDTTINVGISYYYELTSVDKNGNESKRAKTDWVLAPKTP
jgi:hypothetical protein